MVGRFRIAHGEGQDFAWPVVNGAGTEEERRAERKADAARCLAASEDAELLVKEAVGRGKTSSARRDRNDFGGLAHARFQADRSRGSPVMQKPFF